MASNRLFTTVFALTLGTGFPVFANSLPNQTLSQNSSQSSSQNLSQNVSRDLVRTLDVQPDPRLNPQTRAETQRIVYLRGIPIISFLGDSRIANSDRFTALIQQAFRERWNGNQLQPVWEQNQFVLRLGDRTVWHFDNSMVFPEPVSDRQQNVLLITNRLRRKLGAEAPVTAVQNFPDNRRPNNRGLFAQVVRILTGIASWYGPGFHGNRSASGEIFDQNAMTAAHQTLPFGTNVRVTNKATGQSVVVRINDRGPFTQNRVIDISRGAAQRIGLLQAGIAPVKLEVLSKPRN